MCNAVTARYWNFWDWWIDWICFAVLCYYLMMMNWLIVFCLCNASTWTMMMTKWLIVLDVSYDFNPYMKWLFACLSKVVSWWLWWNDLWWNDYVCIVCQMLLSDFSNVGLISSWIDGFRKMMILNLLETLM